MTNRAIKYVDVFSDTQFSGNPVAVILNADGLTDADMQRIAGWTNLSETTFYLPPTTPDADYRLRIFTPRNELPFAGHPTLGSAHAILQAGLVSPEGNALVQECQAGLIPITVEATGTTSALSLEMPDAAFTPLTTEQAAALPAILGMNIDTSATPTIVDVGPRWIVAKMADGASVLAAKPDFAAMSNFERSLGAVGITIYGLYTDGTENDGTAIEVRSFAPSSGIEEDPVCGSGNGSVGAFRLRYQEIINGDAYLAAQGQCVGRNGRISIRAQDGKIYVGGHAITTVDGVVTDPA